MIARATLLAALVCCPAAAGANTPADGAAAPVPPAAAEVPANPPAPPADLDKPKPISRIPLRNVVRFGANLYYGVSNLGGVDRRNTDGPWASGFGFSAPSSLSVDWSANPDQALHVAIGVGDLYNARGARLRQPVEAFYQFRAGSANQVRAGKFYVPFSAQEWDYEAKPGLMLTHSRGAGTYMASVFFNTDTNTPNAYFRAGRHFGDSTEAGLSLGLGRGLMYGSPHGVAAAADVTHHAGSVTLSSEYIAALERGRPFQFLFAKAQLTGAGPWMPYIGGYYWHDAGSAFGRFSSAVAGVGYRLTPGFVIQSGYSRANGRHVYWLQTNTHY
jgi:hypothetical protein